MYRSAVIITVRNRADAPIKTASHAFMPSS